MKFSQELISDALIEEISPLLKMHFDEISHYPDIPLEPDFDRYKQIQASGNLRLYVAREDSGELVGYCVYFVGANIHYKSCNQAVQDILYIDPKKRGFGMKFLLWCDDQLKQDGVIVVYQHLKAKHDFGKMLERIGYEKIDLIYGKRLDNG